MIILTRIAKFVQACLILGFLFSIIPSVSSAAVTKKVDEFDGQTRIISAFKDTDENIKPPFFSDLIFQKSFKNNETPEYLLIIHNKNIFSGNPISSLLAETCIRFNGDKKDAYRLNTKVSRENYVDNFVSYKLPVELIDKILTTNVIEIKITGVRINYLVDQEKTIIVNPEVINEWKQVITQNGSVVVK